MTPVPELQRLVRQCSTADAETTLERVLLLACEQLHMSSAVLGSVSANVHTVDLAVRAGEGRKRSMEGARPVARSFCGFVTDDGPLIVPDVAEAPELPRPDATQLGDVRCYIGISLRGASGAVIGVLGLHSHTVHERLDHHDVEVLKGLAEVAAGPYADLRRDVPAVLDEGGPDEADHDSELPILVKELASLTRPFLDALHELSGIASTFLTAVDAAKNEQHLLLAHNGTDSLSMPEGATIPWVGSMCWRALDDGTPAVFDLPQRGPRIEAAEQLGLITHATVPVRLSDGALWGTLCASDNAARPEVATHLPTLELFARLIAAEVERAVSVADERAQSLLLRLQAQTDELTGCASRRMVHPWLVEALAAAEPDEVVVLAFVDVDRFKGVNDHHGHATGDALLTVLGQRLRGAARTIDLVARQGGDEFLVGARLRRTAVTDFEQRLWDAAHFSLLTADGELSVRCSTGVATSDEAGEAESLLNLSDTNMYRDKNRLAR